MMYVYKGSDSPSSICSADIFVTPSGVQQLTGLSQVLAGFGLGEGGHLVELGVCAGVFEAAEANALTVNNAV